jgi:exosome complex exonuclease RRP6
VDTPDNPTDVSSMDVEIPFIPAPQRSIKELDEEQDTIVVVGQARQKRKRPKATSGPDSVGATSGSAGERIKKTKVKNGVEATKAEDGEAFYFSAVPNILDDNPNLGDGKKKKKREKKEKRGERFSFSFSFFQSNHLNI